MRKIPFTKEGYENVKKEYEILSEKRKSAVQELSTARDMGDRSENAAYKSARWKLSSIDRKLRHLKNLIKFGDIIKPGPAGIVGIGSIVKVHDGAGEIEFIIVGGFESDISQGKISTNSPIGRALVRKKVGDAVTIEIPVGNITYRIIDVQSTL